MGSHCSSELYRGHISFLKKTTTMKFILLTAFVGVALAAPTKDSGCVFGKGHNSCVGQTVWGFPVAKRAAKAVMAAPAEKDDCVFGKGHKSCVGQTVWGFRGKRSAQPAYLHPYGYPYHFGYLALKPLKSGTAVHPGLATSFVERSPQ